MRKLLRYRDSESYTWYATSADAMARWNKTRVKPSGYTMIFAGSTLVTDRSIVRVDGARGIYQPMPL